jgi:hypothetical protein
MARSPAKKKKSQLKGNGAVRNGPRDPRQRVQPASAGGSPNPIKNNSRGRGVHRRSHGRRQQSHSMSISPIREETPLAVGVSTAVITQPAAISTTAFHQSRVPTVAAFSFPFLSSNSNANKTCASSDQFSPLPSSNLFQNGQGVACAGAGEADSDDEVLMLGTSKASSLRGILAYSGDEEPEDLDIQMAVLKTAMVARLAKNCSSNDLTFTPEQLTGFIISLNNHRNDLLKMAQEADVTGSIQQQLVNALPLSLSKKTRKKAQVSEILVELFFVVNEIMNSPSIEMPGRHSPFYKTLEAFITSLVRVRNYCNHELNNKEVKKRALKSMPITGELKSYLFDCVSYFVCPLNNNIPCPR